MPCGNEMIRTLEFIESDYAVKLYFKKERLNNLILAYFICYLENFQKFLCIVVNFNIKLFQYTLVSTVARSFMFTFYESVSRFKFGIYKILNLETFS